MLHVDPHPDQFGAALQLSQLRYVIRSRAAATTLAENYTGYFLSAGPKPPADFLP